jgi:NAD/NADP transhydrogenase beta subunit
MIQRRSDAALEVTVSSGWCVSTMAALSLSLSRMRLGAYNGFGGLAAALEGLGLYLDPNAVNLMRHGQFVAEQTAGQLWVQGIALILSIVIGMMTFTGSMVAFSSFTGLLGARRVAFPFGPL